MCTLCDVRCGSDHGFRLKPHNLDMYEVGDLPPYWGAVSLTCLLGPPPPLYIAVRGVHDQSLATLTIDLVSATHLPRQVLLTSYSSLHSATVYTSE